MKKIKKTIISKNLTILYCIFICQIYEMEFYHQIQALWLAQSGSKNFSSFLLKQLLNPKRSPVISVKFFNIFHECLSNGWLFDEFINFCKKNNIFLTFLKDKAKLFIRKQIILLILGFNLLFYQLIPFSISFIKILKKKKLQAFNFLRNYILDVNILEELSFDLKVLKIKSNLIKYKQMLTLNDLFLLQMIKKCNNNNLLNKIEKIKNK